MDYKKYIADVPDFPEEGVLFRDISPLMLDGHAYEAATNDIAEYAKSRGAELICGPEARGFIVGCPVANKLGVGFAPARKKGKLPRDTVSVTYDLEYGKGSLFMQTDAVKPGQKVLVVDDLMATGGTLKATIDLVEKLGGEVVGTAFIVELKDLNGREKIKDYDMFTLTQY